MANILDEICAKKRDYIAHCKRERPLAQLDEQIAQASPPRGFKAALDQRIGQQHIGLIAEIKKASPSKGLIRADFDPPAIADAYAKGGATCLSVLTDTPYFQGCDDYLKAARAACTLPVLRKDFMLDSYQVSEARAMGADCILLIVAALENSQMKELESKALELNIDVLIEVHDKKELERALTHLQSRLIGINNRNLKTLEIDLQTSIQLSAHIPADYTLVCESGIHQHADITHMQQHNMHCFLVGESLMSQEDITHATQQLLGTEPPSA